MSTYVPVYRPSVHKAPSWSRRQKDILRKRKRDADDDPDGAHDADVISEHSDVDETASRTPFPINNRDPYYVAGHARDKPLPKSPFPHSALRDVEEPSAVAKDRSQSHDHSYVPNFNTHEPSYRKRHLDNLTSIMHTCMLNNDWSHASRAWAVILRIHINGTFVDIRQHGRWKIGAELLMRQDSTGAKSEMNNDLHNDEEDEGRHSTLSALSSQGMALARQYYERLALQYPHVQRHHRSVNSLVIYPALFNIWIYDVQDRAKRARSDLRVSEHPATLADEDEEGGYEKSISYAELDGARAIASRLDELLLSPPYDKSPLLLELRGMVALWTADILRQRAAVVDPSNDDYRSENDGSRSVAEEQRIARDIFRKMIVEKMDLPDEYKRFAKGKGSV